MTCIRYATTRKPFVKHLKARIACESLLPSRKLKFNITHIRGGTLCQRKLKQQSKQSSFHVAALTKTKDGCSRELTNANTTNASALPSALFDQKPNV